MFIFDEEYLWKVKLIQIFSLGAFILTFQAFISYLYLNWLMLFFKSWISKIRIYIKFLYLMNVTKPLKPFRVALIIAWGNFFMEYINIEVILSVLNKIKYGKKIQYES